MKNLGAFHTVYKEELKKAVEDHPEEYGWPVSMVDDVAYRMATALEHGTYNKDSRAFRTTCKRLGIKHTYQAINTFLKGI